MKIFKKIKKLLILIKKANFLEVILSIKSADYRYLFPIFLILFLSFILKTFKWSILVKKQGIKISFLQLIKLNLIGQFYGIATPGRLGNLIRIYYLKEYTKKSYSQSSVSVILDRLVDLIALLILSSIGVLIFIQYLSSSFIYFYLGILFLLSLIVFFIVNQKWNEKQLKFFYQKLVPEKYKKSLKSAYYSFYQNFPNKIDFFLVIFLSLSFWIILMTGSYFIARSIGIDISWIYFNGALTISGIISLLPISINGWGVREATLSILLSPFGVSIEQVLTFSILNFFFFSVTLALIGLIFSVSKK